MEAAAPTIHALDPDTDAGALVERLTGATRGDDGVHVVVHVVETGNVAYARVQDERSTGHGSQRWLRHARRGSSPGGWSQQHHPRSEQHVGAWKDANAATLDRMLIDSCKQAWQLDHDAPYVVEFAAIDLADTGMREP